MGAIALAIAPATWWLMVWVLWRRGHTHLRLEATGAVLMTAGHAVWLPGDPRLAPRLDLLSAGMNGYGMPVTHWLPTVPRPYIIIGALAAVGVIDRLVGTRHRAQRPGRQR